MTSQKSVFRPRRVTIVFALLVALFYYFVGTERPWIPKDDAAPVAVASADNEHARRVVEAQVHAGTETGFLALRTQPLVVPAEWRVTHPSVAAPEPGFGGGGAGDTATLARVLLVLSLIFAFAKIGGEIAARLGQPPVLGELLIGIFIGNLALFNIPALTEFTTTVIRDKQVTEFITILAEIGVILLLFEVGLESTVREMLSVGPSSLLAAMFGLLLPTGMGFGVSYFFAPATHWTTHLFVGSILAATSVGITARVLADLGKMKSRETKIILGAAVIDDVLGLILVAVVSQIVTGARTGESVHVIDVAIIVAKALAFFLLAIALGALLSPRIFKVATYLRVQNVLLPLTLVWCFLITELGLLFGLAPIVGAFAAGLVLEASTFKDWDGGIHRLEEVLLPVMTMLVPIFFVYTGMKVDVASFMSGPVILLALALTIVGAVGKLAAGLGVLEKGVKRLAVGIGMIPRGEVGLIVAAIGLTLIGVDGNPLLSQQKFSAAVLMVALTTIMTPPLLKIVMKDIASDKDKSLQPVENDLG